MIALTSRQPNRLAGLSKLNLGVLIKPHYGSAMCVKQAGASSEENKRSDQKGPIHVIELKASSQPEGRKMTAISAINLRRRRKNENRE